MISLQDVRLDEKGIDNYKPHNEGQNYSIIVYFKNGKNTIIPYPDEGYRDIALKNLDKFLNITCCN